MKDNKLLRPTLYRIGGCNFPNLKKDKYFKLLKYTENIYSEDITEITKSKNHCYLKGVWVILDNNGNELIEMKTILDCPYIIKDSCIYSINSYYYNIKTNELYCYSSTCMQTKDFLFLNNRYDKNKLKRGVLKIDKISGSYELFPE